MNNSFEYVSKCTINNSKSKQTHLFSHSKRFLNSRTSNCRSDAYDLTKTTLASKIVPNADRLPRQERFKTRQSTSPSPDAYLHRSFADINSLTKRGNLFGSNQKIKIDTKKKLMPGPGYYEPINPETKLSYSMRSRINRKENGLKVGPGWYQIENHEAINKSRQIASKYPNPRSTMIGQDTRFKNSQTIGPGPFAHSKTNSDFGKDPTYSFGLLKKEPSYIKKSTIPGPGSYNQFSEFSELKGGLAAMTTRSINH